MRPDSVCSRLLAGPSDSPMRGFTCSTRKSRETVSRCRHFEPPPRHLAADLATNKSESLIIFRLLIRWVFWGVDRRAVRTRAAAAARAGPAAAVSSALAPTAAPAIDAKPKSTSDAGWPTTCHLLSFFFLVWFGLVSNRSVDSNDSDLFSLVLLELNGGMLIKGTIKRRSDLKKPFQVHATHSQSLMAAVASLLTVVGLVFFAVT